ncbi:unnamed protein product, partial [Phaeothamnion confervicola]
MSGRLAKWLSAQLSKYVDKVDATNLQVGLWSGDLQLQDLELRRDALRRFDVPAVLRRGTIGTLRVCVPWKTFVSGKVSVVVSDVVLVLEPLSGVIYDKQVEDAVRAAIFTQKQTKLARAEQILSDGDASASWGSRLVAGLAGSFVARAIRNLTVEVTNIHVVWRDAPDAGFGGGPGDCGGSGGRFFSGGVDLDGRCGGSGGGADGDGRDGECCSAAVGLYLQIFVLRPAESAVVVTADAAGENSAAGAGAAASRPAAAAACKSITVAGLGIYIRDDMRNRESEGNDNDLLPAPPPLLTAGDDDGPAPWVLLPMGVIGSAVILEAVTAGGSFMAPSGAVASSSAAASAAAAGDRIRESSEGSSMAGARLPAAASASAAAAAAAAAKG